MSFLIRNKKFLATSMICTAIGFIPVATHAQSSPLPATGAIFTSDYSCAAVNKNIYPSKGAVWLNGGPTRNGTASLPALTSFYVQVTDPSGATVLGSSGLNKPITTDSYGKFTSCLRLENIVSSSSSGFSALGYDDSPNAGGEYKVWVSTIATFDNDLTKTDNFKVIASPSPESGGGNIQIRKFYDADLDGKKGDGEPEIVATETAPKAGWLVDIAGMDSRYTAANYSSLPVGLATSYIAREFTPDQTNWYPTGALNNNGSGASSIPIDPPNPQYLAQATITLDQDHPSQSIWFGNVCTGAGNGLTLGFWSNKNGQSAIGNYQGQPTIWVQLAMLNLRDALGRLVTPTSTKDLASFLLNGTATNMANMLSVQLATMYLNTKVPVTVNKVTTIVDSDNALIYAPGTQSAKLAGKYGFATVSAVIKEAAEELLIHKLAPAGASWRYYQESLKNALDNANNNRTFVLTNVAACPSSFLKWDPQ